MSLVITAAEVDALNAARSALVEIVRRQKVGRSAGMIEATATHAEWLVFQVLNHANTYGGARLTYAQLHNTLDES